MKISKLIIMSSIAGGFAMLLGSCETIAPQPFDANYNDSIWSNASDSSDTNVDSTGSASFDSGDTTCCGGSDSTICTGGWGYSGDSTSYDSGIDTTVWGDSTNFGG